MLSDNNILGILWDEYLNSDLSYEMIISYPSRYIYPSKEKVDRCEKPVNCFKKIMLIIIYVIHLVRLFENIIKLYKRIIK